MGAFVKLFLIAHVVILSCVQLYGLPVENDDADSENQVDWSSRQNLSTKPIEVKGILQDGTLFSAEDGNSRQKRDASLDPFGGCKLMCPEGFDPEDFHIHMHRKKNGDREGGQDPRYGLWHHDWKERAD
ncbi:uncharacterized protein LOC100905343 [Galendromus occidentalis]|uniref:Uncharacterized protein LOC100905343 n=1 Tax=Galendromus occidentalis TaxID=34638 RepID=A0AAJ6QV93_9ACAR|nr:uncharacterized protein LOC100905343 [Galendromus occidentalis]